MCSASKRLSTEAGPQRRPGTHRTADALEVLCAEVFKFEQVAQELAGAFGNHDAVRFCKALQTRGEVRRLAHNAALLGLSRSNQVANHDQTRRNANARLQGRAGLQDADRSDQLQSCAHRSLGVILMGLGIAEVHEHAIAHVLRYEPAKALHSLGDAFLIGGDDLAQVLRVHTRRECR